MKAIVTDNLAKMFGRLVAVDHISFEVEEGEIFGFLGANGAGKTSTIMMLATALNPSSGTATVCGYDIIRERDAVRESIGIVFEDLSLDTNLTGKENLDFHATLYHLPKKVKDERIAQALDLVELKEKQDILVKYYSGGMQRRLEIARGMLNSPRVLFLDEPTLGLDVQTRRLLWDYAKRLNQESGTTILLNTHYVEEADYLCNRVAILERGKIAAVDTPKGLKDSLGSSVLSIKFPEGALANEFASLLNGMSWIRNIRRHDGQLELSVGDKGMKIPEVVRLARQHGFVISAIGEHKPSLEDVFLHYVGKKLQSNEHE
ncbi:MAG: ATP-binding cassette domain-containing protein [Dehalococcoidia bacterium]|nr:ATP-binding cassette domain-containing protein [Dehalococcoidia bacterium]MDH4299421.1 ATP-binding cassette domain-containing protein [Dehalococcoidia bacterium]